MFTEAAVTTESEHGNEKLIIEIVKKILFVSNNKLMAVIR